MPGPSAANGGFVGLGGQPTLRGWDCYCTRHHCHCACHRGGCCGDGGKEQEEEPREELGHRVADPNSEPSILRQNLWEDKQMFLAPLVTKMLLAHTSWLLPQMDSTWFLFPSKKVKNRVGIKTEEELEYLFKFNIATVICCYQWTAVKMRFFR